MYAMNTWINEILFIKSSEHRYFSEIDQKLSVSK